MAPRRGNKFLALPRPQKFQVDAIVNRRTLSNGKAEYLVKWNGYPESEKSWEPEENLDCMELVEKFATFYKRIEAAKPLGPIERITGSARINDQIFYFVKYSGAEKAEILPSRFVRKNYPMMVIEFYEAHYIEDR